MQCQYAASHRFPCRSSDVEVTRVFHEQICLLEVIQHGEHIRLQLPLIIHGYSDGSSPEQQQQERSKYQMRLGKRPASSAAYVVHA